MPSDDWATRHPELAITLWAVEHLSPQQQDLLRDLLAHCDLVKFTGLAPSAAEWTS